MKKALYIIVSALELIFVIGALVVYICTRKFMGMARFVALYNQRWEKAYPVELLMWIVVGILIILTILVLVLFARHAMKKTAQTWAMIIGMLVLNAVYVGIALAFSADSLRSYYFVTVLLSIAAYLQTIKALVFEIWYFKRQLKTPSVS